MPPFSGIRKVTFLGDDLPEVRFEILKQDLPLYLHAAEFLDIPGEDVVCAGRELGIYGATAGSHVLVLLLAKMQALQNTVTSFKQPNG